MHLRLGVPVVGTWRDDNTSLASVSAWRNYALAPDLRRADVFDAGAALSSVGPGAVSVDSGTGASVRSRVSLGGVRASGAEARPHNPRRLARCFPEVFKGGSEAIVRIPWTKVADTSEQSTS